LILFLMLSGKKLKIVIACKVFFFKDVFLSAFCVVLIEPLWVLFILLVWYCIARD
jgi:hypothetical protein